MKTKKTIIRIFSILLALASLIGLLAAAGSFRQSMDAKAHWEKTRADALESFRMLEDGILQLKANEAAYTEGVETLEEGEKALEAGKNKLGAGQASLAEGEAALAEGQASYDTNAAKLAAGEAEYQAGLKELEAGKAEVAKGKADLQAGYAALDAAKAELAAGEAELAAHQAEYEDGKARLARVTPIYQAAKAAEADLNAKRAAYNQAVANGDAIAAGVLQLDVAASEAAMNAALAGYSMNGIIAEYEAGQAQLAAYEAGQARVASGREQIAAAEQQLADGEAKVAAGEAKVAAGQAKLDASKVKLDEGRAVLAAGKQKLDAGRDALSAGYAEYYAGKQQLKDGTQELADGLAQLGEYEGGQLQVVEGLDLVIGTETYFDSHGNALIVSIADRLGPDFNYWTVDEDGNTVILNDELFLDLDKALEVVATGRAFVNDTTEAVTKEITGRVEVLLLTAGAAVLGLLSAVLGLIPKRIGSMVFALLCAICTGAAIAFGQIDGMEYPFCTISGDNSPILLSLFAALCILAAAALVQFIVTIVCRLSKAAGEVPVPGAPSAPAAPAVNAAAAAAPAAAPVYPQGTVPFAPGAPLYYTREGMPVYAAPGTPFYAAPTGAPIYAAAPVQPAETAGAPAEAAEVPAQPEEAPAQPVEAAAAAPASAVNPEALAAAFAAFMQSDSFKKALEQASKGKQGE